uniref:Uncharacterized protein n=1 Tax=Rhizophora mucronata TaxID=61149 RepID=A0A2P2QKI3_RHIMU
MPKSTLPAKRAGHFSK